MQQSKGPAGCRVTDLACHRHAAVVVHLAPGVWLGTNTLHSPSTNKGVWSCLPPCRLAMPKVMQPGCLLQVDSRSGSLTLKPTPSSAASDAAADQMLKSLQTSQEVRRGSFQASMQSTCFVCPQVSAARAGVDCMALHSQQQRGQCLAGVQGVHSPASLPGAAHSPAGLTSRAFSLLLCRSPMTLSHQGSRVPWQPAQPPADRPCLPLLAPSGWHPAALVRRPTHLGSRPLLPKGQAAAVG